MRIAHISDLHLRHHLPGSASIETRLSRLMPEYFARALSQIRLLEPDLLAISGDLLDYPLDAMNDPTALDQGRQDLELIAELLSEVRLPVAMVHGNHDHPQLIQEVFGHIPNDQVVNGYRILTFSDDEGPNHVPVRAGREQARFLAALHEESSLPQVHIQHYIVWPEHNEEYPHTYGAGRKMRDAIIASGNVRLVLSGHFHKGVALFNDKGVWYATSRAFTEAPHPFAIYDLNDDMVSSRNFTLAR